jgi:hypothetical protein
MLPLSTAAIVAGYATARQLDVAQGCAFGGWR